MDLNGLLTLSLHMGYSLVTAAILHPASFSVSTTLFIHTKSLVGSRYFAFSASVNSSFNMSFNIDTSVAPRCSNNPFLNSVMLLMA
ncbi:hypothetical protein HDV64DRAFT_246001 [Trichoderma sp. TUCIM 5745]